MRKEGLLTDTLLTPVDSHWTIPAVYRVRQLFLDFLRHIEKITQHSYKISDFVAVKKIWKKYILAMTLFPKIAASCYHLLYPGPEPLSGPGHGVPLEVAHHLFHLVDQGVLSPFRTLINIQLNDATCKIAH